MATVNSRTESAGSTLGPRKTMIIMVTVVGCIAILWPKVFYPMMVGPGQTKTMIKDHRGPGCCDVVLDQETFANASIDITNQHNLFRKRNIGPVTEDSSIRQERPPHLRPETVHPAMRERGRAISHGGPAHSERTHSPPRIVEGRPGPIPGMRPPMGAGSHQSTKSATSMGFIMPLYTIGIVSFFIYTILKLIFKKTPPTPYPEIKPDPAFRNEVFTPEPYIKRPDSGTSKLVVTAIQGLISAADEQLLKIDSLRKSASNLSKEPNEADDIETLDETPEASEHINTPTTSSNERVEPDAQEHPEQKSNTVEDEAPHEAKPKETGAVRKKRDVSEERANLKVIPMEKKATYEAGKHPSRPGTPVQSLILDSSIVEQESVDSKCILLDPKVQQTSKVMVADSDLAVETLDASQKKDEETPFDLNLIVVFESLSSLNQGRSLELNVLLGSEPTAAVNPSAATRVASPTREVVLSGKMKLSLVKLDDNENKSSEGAHTTTAQNSSNKDGAAFGGRFGPNEE